MLLTGLFCVTIHNFLVSMLVLAEGAITSEKEGRFKYFIKINTLRIRLWRKFLYNIMYHSRNSSKFSQILTIISY